MERICTTSLIQGPLEEIVPWIEWHLKLGVDHMFLFLDHPNDDLTSKYKHESRITFTPVDHDQIRQMQVPHPTAHVRRQFVTANKAWKSAIDQNFDWIIHFDQDEFIACSNGLCNELSKIDKATSYVRFGLLELQPEFEPPKKRFDEPLLFRRRQSRIQRVIMQLRGCGGTMIKHRFLRGHQASKCAIRVQSEQIKHINIHSPKLNYGTLEFDRFHPNIDLIHFNCLSYKHWRHKMTHRHQSKNQSWAISKDKAWQMNAFVEYLHQRPKDLPQLFQKIYGINRRQKKILLALGALEQHTLFLEQASLIIPQK
ncbi:MAG: glycosyltransferase family 2 protein [Verrucomicrobiota bacterium]